MSVYCQSSHRWATRTRNMRNVRTHVLHQQSSLDWWSVSLQSMSQGCHDPSHSRTRSNSSPSNTRAKCWTARFPSQGLCRSSKGTGRMSNPQELKSAGSRLGWPNDKKIGVSAIWGRKGLLSQTQIQTIQNSHPASLTVNKKWRFLWKLF